MEQCIYYRTLYNLEQCIYYRTLYNMEQCIYCRTLYNLELCIYYKTLYNLELCIHSGTLYNLEQCTYCGTLYNMEQCLYSRTVSISRTACISIIIYNSFYLRFCSSRRYVSSTFCIIDVLYHRRFVSSTFCIIDVLKIHVLTIDVLYPLKGCGFFLNYHYFFKRSGFFCNTRALIT